MMKYYVRHVHSYERATTMEKQLMHFCRSKVGYVMSERRLKEWIEEIRKRQLDIKTSAPRIKTVEISVSKAYNDDGLISSIRIGEGYVGLDKVSGEEV